MPTSRARHWLGCRWLTLVCGLALVLAATALAAPPTPEEAATTARSAADVPEELTPAAIEARIAVISARTDIPVQERDLVLKQLHAVATRLEGAAAARKGAADYAAAVQAAPQAIAALNSESVASPLLPTVDAAELDPMQAQVKLASLQAQAVSLRSKQRDLEESLRTMGSRQDETIGELADLHRQLDEPQGGTLSNASLLQVEANNLLNEATRQELSARIDKTEQELLSLPARESATSAQRDLTTRQITQVDEAIAALTTRITAQRKLEAEKRATQAQEFAQRLEGQPSALREFASQNTEIRVSLKSLNERLDQARGAQQQLRTQQGEVVEARKNAEQILAIGRISDESGRLLRDLRAHLPGRDVTASRIARREDTIVEARLQRLQTRQELNALQSGEAAAERYLVSNSVASTPSNVELMTTLVEHRRAALTDLEEAQRQLIAVLSQANAVDSDLMQGTDQLRLLLDKRLLWLPSARPIGTSWIAQLGSDVGWLFAPSNWSGVPRALAATPRTHWFFAVVWLAAIVVLFVFRRRLIASLATLARHVGDRDDSFRLTVLACAATVLLAMTWPLAIAAASWMLRASGTPDEFSSALGMGLRNVAIVLFMLGVFIDMCRAHGVFIAHFGWAAQGTRRLSRALRLLLLAIAPAALLAGMADASGNPELVEGIGRLGFLIGSLALALFLRRVFRSRGGALTSALDSAGWVKRSRGLWSSAFVVIPLLLAGLAAIGYFATARELQGRLFTSGWIILAVVIVFFVAMRGVLVASRRAAWRQADERRAKVIAEAAQKTDAGDGSVVLNLQNQEAGIDAVTVSRQTRALLRAIGIVVTAALLWSIWSGVTPALNVFNDIVLWSHLVSTSTGEKVAAVTLGNVLLSMLMLVLTGIAARNLPGFLEITLLQRFRIDSGTRYAIATIGRYLILGIGLMMAFNQIGADWSQLKWLVAALGLGLGFGLQEIVANFISGLIILFERPVRVGDTISIGPTTGTVSRIKIRAITITDFDNFEVIVPNKAFITETVQNWSLTSEVTRLVITLGVGYGSDVERTRKILLDVAAANPRVLASPAPAALFLRFGDSALEFELRAYVATIDQRVTTRHELHVALTAALKDAGIEIPFPQRDVHVRYPGAEISDDHGG